MQVGSDESHLTNLVMNILGQEDDGAKGLHPGAIFVGDTVESVVSKLDRDQQQSSGRVEHDATKLFATTTDKNLAMANAKFLSECCMSGVPTSAATSAASQARQRFEKWWVKQCLTTGDMVRPFKRKRQENTLCETPTDEKVESVPPRIIVPDCIMTAKTIIKSELSRTGGDTTSPIFYQSVETLHQWYSARTTKSDESGLLLLDGSWTSLNRPSFSECLGRNGDGHFLYTLGRIAFDVFRPTNLICSIKGCYNLIKPVDAFNNESARPRTVPSRLQSEANAKDLRIYDTISLIQIEANQTRSGVKVGDATAGDDFIIRQPIQARMTNHGFLLPDPEVKDRYSVHFTGGSLRPREREDLALWKEVFDPQLAPPYKVKELAHMLASNIYLGAATQAMREDGSLRYNLKRPIGGHGQAYIDVLYNDDNLCVVRGHHGSHFCFCR